MSRSRTRLPEMQPCRSNTRVLAADTAHIASGRHASFTHSHIASGQQILRLRSIPGSTPTLLALSWFPPCGNAWTSRTSTWFTWYTW